MTSYQRHSIIIICALLSAFCLLSCTPLSPFTSAPGYILMGHDYVTKPARLKEYAEEGDVYSQYDLGMRYCCGSDTWNDNKKGLHWLCTAAHNGYAKAQLALGDIYANANEYNPPPVPVDNVKAYRWYSVADSYMNFQASEKKKALEEKLSPAQIKKAGEMQKNWRKAKCGV